MKPLTIAYFTSRQEPREQWFCDSLSNELKGRQELEVIFVDFWTQYNPEERFKKFEAAVAGRFPFRVVAPKPSAWQGKYRKTPADWWSASAARNSAFCYCKHDFIACIDDLSIVVPGWLDQVNHANDHQHLVMGSYKKLREMVVEKGVLVSCQAGYEARDCRWGSGSPDGNVEMNATNLFGCSFALPIDTVLQVNGFDEECDGTSFEDQEFGARISRTGIKSFYSQNMTSLESEEAHGEGPKMIRHSIEVKGWSTLGHNGKTERGSDWYILKTGIYNPNKKWTARNDFNLRELREQILNGGEFPLPTVTHDWRDGKPLGERNES